MRRTDAEDGAVEADFEAPADGQRATGLTAIALAAASTAATAVANELWRRTRARSPDGTGGRHANGRTTDAPNRSCVATCETAGSVQQDAQAADGRERLIRAPARGRDARGCRASGRDPWCRDRRRRAPAVVLFRKRCVVYD